MVFSTPALLSISSCRARWETFWNNNDNYCDLFQIYKTIVSPWLPVRVEQLGSSSNNNNPVCTLWTFGQVFFTTIYYFTLSNSLKKNTKFHKKEGFQKFMSWFFEQVNRMILWRKNPFICSNLIPPFLIWWKMECPHKIIQNERLCYSVETSLRHELTQGGRDPLIVVICYSLKDVQFYSFYPFLLKASIKVYSVLSETKIKRLVNIIHPICIM